MEHRRRHKPYAGYQLIETGRASRIGNNAFNGDSRLLKVISVDTLKTVDDGTFTNCTSLKIVSIASVETIGNEAFMGNTAIKEDIDIRGAKDIGQYTFTGCTYMNDILLGENIEYNKYTKASFIKYSTIRDTLVNVDFTGQSMAKAIYCFI